MAPKTRSGLKSGWFLDHLLTHRFYYSFEYHTLFSSKEGVAFETVVKSLCFYYTFSTGVIWEPSGSLGAPLGHSWPLLLTLCCPALLLLPPLGPQTSLCASLRPPFFPSTSCPHRFPLGAAVSRSAYNPPPSLRGQSVLNQINPKNQ